MKRRRTTLALLFDRLASEYAVMLRRSVERAASKNDVGLLIVTGQPLGDTLPSLKTQNEIYGFVNQDAVDGVIVVSATLGHFCGVEGLTALCQSYAPLPVCSMGVALPGIPSVVIENSGGTQLAVQHLIDVHKARRIAFIAGPKSSVESDLRVDGYLRALANRKIEFEPRLLVHGSFTLPSGCEGMRELLASKQPFDAVVSANDDMALGALDVLRSAGLNVPRDVQVIGFDDINSAHFARPPLSTLRQPLWWMGECAVDGVLRRLRGESVPLLSAGPVELVRRESCGCGYQAGHSLVPDGFERANGLSPDRREHVAGLLRGAVSIPSEALGNWPMLLLEAVDRELFGAEGHFSGVLEEVLERAQAEGASLDEFQRVVSVMRAEFLRVSNTEQQAQLERLWHNARVLVGAASIRLLGRQKINQHVATSRLSWVGEKLTTTLSQPLLRKELIEGLPLLEIDRAAVSLHTAPGSKHLKVLAMRTEAGELAVANEVFPETELAPRELFDTEKCQHFVVLPVTFESEMLGVAVFGGSAQPGIYDALRLQIGSAVKGAMLHREVVAQVMLRSQLEAERVAKEARIAADIQTSMNPVLTLVPGLEIAAVMAPAGEAGGDYYDVIPTPPRGAWLGIGDVTGHGLGAGLIMLMIQSMVAGLSRLDPAPSPSQVIAAVGEGLWDSVRLRLKRDDHATLTVFRYHGGGRFKFAGAHEDLIVWRQRTQTCEVIPTTGFWVGALPSVRHLTEDSELRLEPGDVLLLYTDGVTEARNNRHEQFSTERLARYLSALGELPVATIRDRIHDSVLSWSTSLDDDITLVVIRYLGD